jgi:hypothetical protein
MQTGPGVATESLSGGRTLASATLAAVLLVAIPAAAQTPSAGAYTDLTDHLRLDVGGFRIAADTQLQYSVGRPSEPVDFEDETALPGNSTTYWIDGTWRVGRRHQVSLNFTHAHRAGDPRPISRTITWGDRVFELGTTLQSESSADILTGYYRFAIVRNDRFEAGPTAGVGYLWLSATLRAAGETRSGDVTGDTGSITGALGGYFAAWAHRRVQFRGDLLYILVKPERSEASVTDGRLGLYWYPWKRVGFGGQYKYYKYRYERSALSAEVGGSIRYHGGQAFLSFLF